jgi:hypothetical protein
VAIRVESTTVHEDRVGQFGPVLDRTIVDLLFGNIGQPDGQSEAFFEFAMDLARKADNARRQFEED